MVYYSNLELAKKVHKINRSQCFEIQQSFQHDVMLKGLYFILALRLILAELHNTCGSDLSCMRAWVPDAGNRVFSSDNWVPDDRSGGGWKHQTNAADKLHRFCSGHICHLKTGFANEQL